VGAPLDCRWLGRVGYRPTWQRQEAVRAAVLDGSGAEALFLLEHQPVVTLGRAADPANLLVDEAALSARGIELCRTSRGGDVTFHGPGQLVAYPVVRVGGVRAHVEAMARAVIEVVGALGIDASFHRERVGVWVGDSKLCAFGIHVHRRVAIHGLALNVDTPADGFSLIVPCGLRGLGVTSIAEQLGGAPPVFAVARLLAAALCRQLGRSPAGDLADAAATDRPTGALP